MWQPSSMPRLLTCVTRPLIIVAIMSAPLLAACAAEPNRTVEVTSDTSEAPSKGPVSSGSTSGEREPAKQPMPCNPGSGSPLRKDGCPDPKPDTGWLTASNDTLSLKPFRTLRNDAKGEAYARKHGEEYPFSNDYFDARTGTNSSTAPCVPALSRLGTENP